MYTFLYGIHSTHFSLLLIVCTFTYGEVRKIDTKSHTKTVFEGDNTFTYTARQLNKHH
jgi:hypothetical protein